MKRTNKNGGPGDLPGRERRDALWKKLGWKIS